jgi:acetyl-CoA acetyltransferase
MEACCVPIEKGYIVGVGETPYTRRSGRSAESLALEAIKAALADADIAPGSVDGMVGYFRSVPAEDLAWAFPGLHYLGTTRMSGASSVEALHTATAALNAGAAEVIIAYQARNGSSGQRVGQRVLARATGAKFRHELEHPYGWITPAHWYSMICRRHMMTYGTTAEHLGAVALTMRANAQRNPRALTYGRPLTAEDYMRSPMVADPYRKLDCCLESDGACAVVMVSAEAARRLGGPGIEVAGVGTGQAQTPDELTNREDWFETGVRYAARAAFEMAGVGPGDIDAAMIYDCFTFEVLHQLEEAGFCREGESGPFAAAGGIGIGGSLPVNLHGGLLGEAHMLGMNHIIEAVRQLRGQAGERQLASPRWIAVSGWGGMCDGTFAVMRNGTGR